MVAAPTMRVPGDVSRTVNAYLAFRAILLEIVKFNIANAGQKIESVVCSGLATGIGEMSPYNCATQMKKAYEVCSKPARIPNLGSIHADHFKMRAKEPAPE